MNGSNGSNGSAHSSPGSVASADLDKPIFWRYDDAAHPGGATAANLGADLVNLRFVVSAISRSKRIWLTLAVIGLLTGCALFATAGSSYSASVSILMSEDPQGEIGGISAESLMARNPTVAATVVRELGLPMSPTAFLGAYSANITPLTTSTNISNNNNVINSPVLVINVTARTPAQATSEANALVAEFLKYRTRILQRQVSAPNALADQEIANDRTAVASLQTQVSAFSAEPKSAARQQQLSTLQSEERTAASALSAAETDAAAAESSRQLTVSTMISGTQILSSTPAALTASRKVTALEDIGSPFIGCLMIGLAIVVVGAVTSNRLRRRDDIAAALGSPVKLSVSAYGGASQLPSGPGRRQCAAVDVRRIVGYLTNVAKEATPRPTTLAVMAVDNSPAVVPLVTAVAASLAEEQMWVAVADLSDHILARDVGEDRPGVHTVKMHDSGVLLVVPEIGGELETGPLRSAGAKRPAQSTVAAAYAGADVVIAIAAYDPSLGGEYIATWATEAVVVITAGKSSAVRIQSVGEMLRAAKVRVISAIVLGADKDDDTPGTVT